VADWIWVQKRQIPPEAFFAPLLGWGGFFCLWGYKLAPGLFVAVLPLPVAGGLLAAIVYLLWQAALGRKSGALVSPSEDAG
jgi:hypothetical protein